MVGLTIPALSGYHWADHRKTLIIAIRKGCHFCEDSLPFYKRLQDTEASNALHAHLLTVMPDDRNAAGRVLQAANLRLDGIFGQPLDLIKVTGTPTLILVDSAGKVKHAWVGQLTAEREKEVISVAEE